MGTKNIITPWSFRDGRDYVISLNVGESSSSISVKVTDKITAEEWSCTYDAEYIESLTQRTGSFKPFDVFVSMIKSAILKKSESVAIELMNIDDLELLRTQKRQSNAGVPPDWKLADGSGNGEKVSTSNLSYLNEKPQSVSSASSKKKYLIVTYVAEFDKVHYPIPLNYSGPPDPMVMQNNIKKLNKEVSTLRHAKSALEEEVIFLKQQVQDPKPPESNSIYDDLNISSPQSHPYQYRPPHRNQEVRGGADMNNNSHPEDEAKIHKLVSIIEKLEDKIRDERAGHNIKLEKLGAENDFLRLKFEGAEKYGIELKTEIHELEKQISYLNEALQQLQVQQEKLKGNSRRYDTYTQHSHSGCNSHSGNSNNVRSGHNNHYQSNDRDVRGEKNSYNTNYRQRASSTESVRSGNGNNYRGMAYNKKRDDDHDQRDRYGKSSTGLHRGRSVSPAMPHGRSRFQAQPRPTDRSPSPSRSPFDPTAFVTERKLKQDRMAELRLENIKNRINRVGNSSSRSRSNSQESLASNRTYRTSRNLLSAVCSVCGHACSGSCTSKTSNTVPEQSSLANDPEYGQYVIPDSEQPNSVDNLLSEAIKMTRVSPPPQFRQGHQPPSSPVRIPPPPRTPAGHRKSSGNISKDTRVAENKARTPKKASEPIIANGRTGLNQRDKKVYSPLKSDPTRKRNSTAPTSKRTYQDMHKGDRNSKKPSSPTASTTGVAADLDSKLTALKQLLEKHRKVSFTSKHPSS